MPVTTLLRRVLNRSNTEPNLADAYLTPQPSATPALELIPEESPTAGDDGAQNVPATTFDNIDEAPPVLPEFSDSTFLEGEGKVEMGEETTSEKDAIEDLTNLETEMEHAAEEQAQGQNVAQDRLPRNAGFMRSFSNVVCIIIGTGCLQIPYAFAKTGWIGIIIVVLSAFIGGYTGVLTIRCLYYRSGERLHSFPQIGYAAFGKWGQYATQFFNYLYSLGTTCLYIILSGQFIYQLVSTLGVTVTQKVWMIIVAIIIWIPVAILKEMSEAAIMAIFGLLASVI
ncbi:hypothetical protein IW150_007181, partial [Coemansia sp. RSA 2607]